MAASSSANTLAAALLALVLAVHVAGTQGQIACENLDRDTCSFAVSSLGKRCVLEKQVKRGGEIAYICRSSNIEADQLDYIETSHCVNSCGLNRRTLGISSDALLESRSVRKLCSIKCYYGCPNIVDLYFNLAAGEGVFLPKLCEAMREDGRRGLQEIQSSGMVSGADVDTAELAAAPAPQP